MKMNPTRIFIIAFLMLFSIAFLAFFNSRYNEHPRALPTLGNPGHKVGDFTFINQMGDTITQDEVNGKIRVVEYFFTTCQGICPKMNENMTEVHKAFRGDTDIMILSHTVDPDNDNVETMRAYASKHEADEKQWMFFTGEKKDLYEMAVRSYLITGLEDKDYDKKITPDFIHSQYFILVDKYNSIRGAYDGTDIKKVKKLIEDIKELKKEKEPESN